MEKWMDKGVKGPDCMLNCWFILLSDLALCLITAACPFFLLNSISNYLYWVTDSLFCVDVYVWRHRCQQVESDHRS